MFKVYQLDHPLTDESKVLDGRSYLWASLFGPFYVLANGLPLLALLMALISATIVVVAFVAFSLVDSFLGSELIIIVAIFAVPVSALTAQGVAAVELVRWGYLRRGWRGGY
ncbi:MAG: hypothetical protein PSV46_06115 [Reyranella sp.]|nr:hypothetical protein [Reyranella sp.]